MDYYGNKDNYIHLKFGECLKMYNFTKEFRKEYPKFVKAYEIYWNDNRQAFKNPFQVVNYVFNNKIPVHFYYNFSDEPADDRDEIIEYLLNENNKSEIYDWEIK